MSRAKPSFFFWSVQGEFEALEMNNEVQVNGSFDFGFEVSSP